MKQIPGILILALLVFLFTAGGTGAQPEAPDDRTLSPYFFVKSEKPDLDLLPLQTHAVEVSISGVIADVRVTQTYKNEGKRPIEAVYVFPASTRAAVYGMKMTLGDRTVVAQIQKREEARQAYEQAKEAGKSASLLEQHRPNVFQMNVANILPSDVIEVELKYTELLVPTGGIYEFIYPTVVGPRYSNQPLSHASSGESWVQNPYLHAGESPSYSFDLNLHLAAGLPIQEITSSSHKVQISYEGPANSSVSLDPLEREGGNRDFILKYRLAGNQIQTGLLLFEGEEENFFLAMVQPPKRVRTEEIPPREYLFIVDVSGSMNGFPLEISKKLLRNLIVNLRHTDRFNVLLFAGGSSLLSEQSLPATQEQVAKALAFIERQRGGGGTELLPALKRALDIPKEQGFSRSIIIATDGYVTVEEAAFELIRNNLGEANVFPFGIGSSVNRHLIEGMARIGQGEAFVITKPHEAPEKAKKFREMIQLPVLTDVGITFDQFQVYDMEPQTVPDVLAERPVMVFGKWRGRLQGSIEVSGKKGDGTIKQKIDVAKVSPRESNGALRYLWARHRVTLLSDYNRLHSRDERVKEVTNLGLTYNLLTAYTSFVAIDSQVRLKGGKADTVVQPLPLPLGVSDLAVGGRALQKRALSAPTAPMVYRAKEAECVNTSLRAEEAKAIDAEGDVHGAEDASLHLEKIKVSRGLSKSQVREVIGKILPTLDRCYSPENKKGPHFQAMVTLLVDQSGRVSKVIMDLGDLEDEALEACLTRNLKTLLFPAPSKAAMVKVSITFRLK